MSDFDATRDAELLDALARELGAEIDPGARMRLLRYAELVAQWSRKTDLVSARDARSLAEVSFLDALVLARPDVVPEGASVVDVGAGAGAPTLPLALLRPDVRVTLVEPRRRRVTFVRVAIGTLDLPDRAVVVERQVDPGDPEASLSGGPFHVALSRATFEPAEWQLIGLRLAPRVLVLTAAAEPPAPPEGARRVALHRYRVPSSGAPRVVSVVER